VSNFDFILQLPNLAAFWTFDEAAGSPRKSLGADGCELAEMAGPIARVEDGVFSPFSAELVKGQWFCGSRTSCPSLNIHGSQAQVTVVAWIKRKRKPEIQCEAIAGMWNETQRKRQYALFLDLRINHSADQVGGHVSNVGGPTPGFRYCMDAAIGRTCIDYGDNWECVGFTYDGAQASVYRNGCLDARPGLNPYPYPGGLFDGGADGADFTVGAVHRSGEMGNWFTGRLGGLLVCATALSPETMLKISDQTLPGKSQSTLNAMKWREANLDYLGKHA
jgi:hypothetical protein